MARDNSQTSSDPSVKPQLRSDGSQAASMTTERRVDPGVVQNDEECCTFAKRIADNQRRAILLLLIGKSDVAVANELGVHRNTIGRWKQSEMFRVAFHGAQKRVFASGMDKARTVAIRSIRELERQLKDRDSLTTRFRAAKTLINLVGVDRLAPKLEEGEADEYFESDGQDDDGGRAA